MTSQTPTTPNTSRMREWAQNAEPLCTEGGALLRVGGAPNPRATELAAQPRRPLAGTLLATGPRCPLTPRGGCLPLTLVNITTAVYPR